MVESSILAKLREFRGQLGNLCVDVNNHERCLNHLNSQFLKQDALLTGYKATNDKLMTSLRTDVNDACAKFPELCRELVDSSVGLVTSIKEIEAIIQGL